MKIGIIIAMDVEYRQMMEVLGGKTEGRIGNNDIVLWQCGIGKVNAAIGAYNLIREHRPDVILSTGLAGGIDMDMRVMDVMVAATTCYHDVWCGEGNEKGQVQGLPPRFVANDTLLQTAHSLGTDTGLRMVEGLLCTGDQFITSREEQARIKADFPQALAVDMESAAIAHACFLQHVPFMSIRIISDTPGNTDNHQQQWADFLASMCNQSFQWMQRFLAVLPDSIPQ